MLTRSALSKNVAFLVQRGVQVTLNHYFGVSQQVAGIYLWKVDAVCWFYLDLVQNQLFVSWLRLDPSSSLLQTLVRLQLEVVAVTIIEADVAVGSVAGVHLSDIALL